VYYQGRFSPDFYGWVFPHGDTLSIGTGSADKGFSLRGSVQRMREACGLAGAETLRREGAPIPMKPLPRWDNGRDVVLAGDAAGVVAPASGEGIYYAMVGGQLAAEAAQAMLSTGNRAAAAGAQALHEAARHGVPVLGIMQWFWYGSEKRRERFVKICEDRDVQQLTFESYMNKQLVRKKPMAHVRIFLKDVGHLLGWRGYEDAAVARPGVTLKRSGQRLVDIAMAITLAEWLGLAIYHRSPDGAWPHEAYA
jgi:geranylgeranyl diphosphate/geranylgeranyl-bacteriochlorophyllide a reductase